MNSIQNLDSHSHSIIFKLQYHKLRYRMKLTQQLLVLLTAAVTSSAYVVVPSTMTSTCRYGSTETPDNANGSVTTASLVSPIALAPTIFTSEQIDAILPHRYPFALVDKVVEYEAGKSAVGVKCVTKVCFIHFVRNRNNSM